MRRKSLQCVFGSYWLLFTGLLAAGAPPGEPLVSLRGRVTDPSGASIPGAVATLAGPRSYSAQKTTNLTGDYEFSAVPAGAYTLRVKRKGFAVFEVQDLVIDRARTLDIQMTVTLEKQELTVSDDRGKVNVDPNSSVGALVLRGADLDALSDDPDQLQQDLQALAGPAAGPNGGQVFIDGFSGGQLPPKSSIREVRINQNPFSAEYDRLGFGRIEIFTKPGTDKFRGQLMANFSDNVLNARNPFLADRPPYQSRMGVFTFSGPVTKKSSFTFDIEHRRINEDAVVNALVLDSNNRPTPFSQAMQTPQYRTMVVPRLDYQLSSKNTLTLRYSYFRVSNDNAGVGNFALSSQAYDSRNSEHTFQATETAVLSARAVNETRLQFDRSRMEQDGDNTIPTVQVLDAFTGGGSQIGRSWNFENKWEAQNLTTITQGRNTFKFGGRLRTSSLSDYSAQNFGGTFTFAGGPAPELDSNGQPVLDSEGKPVMAPISSIERYARTQRLLAMGLPMEQIRLLGGGATQFTIAGGRPLSSLSQTDAGLFALDDWRLKPNFTLSLGLRYEAQTNISDHGDFAPRLGFAWGLGKPGRGGTKTVVRGGFGIFYDRFQENLVLQSLRFNGTTQQQYVVINPAFYPQVPSTDSLGASEARQTIRLVDPSLMAPRILQSSIGIERQLPFNSTISVNYAFSRGIHMLRSRNINAPLPDGSRPYADQGNLYQYESTGFLRQNQLITMFNLRPSSRFSLFGFYTLNSAKGDTDGASTFPAYSYDLHDEYGSTTMDVRHRFFAGGMLTAPGRITLSPFIVASSGQPFNITTGRDNTGDTVFTDRPALAADPAAPGVVITQWGAFILNPKPGQALIPRNYGRGPSQFSINLRLSRTWGFGKRAESGPGADWRPPGMGGRPPGGPGGPGPVFLGGRRPGMFGDSTGKRFNLTLGIAAHNLLNRVNLAAPVGNLGSPFFGESTAIAGGFGPMGGSQASNRRIDVQLRFTF